MAYRFKRHVDRAKLLLPAVFAEIGHECRRVFSLLHFSFIHYKVNRQAEEEKKEISEGSAPIVGHQSQDKIS